VTGHSRPVSSPPLCSESPPGDEVTENRRVNQSHLEFLASDQWAEMLKTELLSWVDGVGDLGDDVLEIGPGPGRTTDLLSARAGRVTAVELDEQLAEDLRERLRGTTVEVLTGDGTATGLEDGRFSAVTAFSVLHHIPTAQQQDRLFSELARLLRPGGVFVGTDSRDLDTIRLGHVDDIFVPVDPETLPDRLRAAGFTDIAIDTTDFHIRFSAHKPPAG
jgi:SAM-dependent methyltransferase